MLRLSDALALSPNRLLALVNPGPIVCLNERRVLSFADFHGLCVLEDGPTADEFRTSILQERFNTFVEAVDDALFPSDQVAHVQFRWTRYGDAHVAVFLGVLGKVVEGMSGMNQCFAWNATSNKASSSGSFTFNDDELVLDLVKDATTNAPINQIDYLYDGGVHQVNPAGKGFCEMELYLTDSAAAPTGFAYDINDDGYIQQTSLKRDVKIIVQNVASK